MDNQQSFQLRVQRWPNSFQLFHRWVLLGPNQSAKRFRWNRATFLPADCRFRPLTSLSDHALQDPAFIYSIVLVKFVPTISICVFRCINHLQDSGCRRTAALPDFQLSPSDFQSGTKQQHCLKSSVQEVRGSSELFRQPPGDTNRKSPLKLILIVSRVRQCNSYIIIRETNKIFAPLLSHKELKTSEHRPSWKPLSKYRMTMQSTPFSLLGCLLAVSQFK